MKTSHLKLKRLLGISPDHGPLRLARLPFILSHVVAYALAFLMFQIIGYILVQTGNQTYEMGDFAFSIFLLSVSIILVPIHIRRAHDLAWSAKSVLWFSVLPSLLRVVCFVVPLAFFTFMPESLPTLMKAMPYIGLLYWFLNQLQMAFLVILAFAPGTGTHNRFGDATAKSFAMKSLYGFQMMRSRASKSESKTEELSA